MAENPTKPANSPNAPKNNQKKNNASAITPPTTPTNTTNANAKNNTKTNAKTNANANAKTNANLNKEIDEILGNTGNTNKAPNAATANASGTGNAAGATNNSKKNININKNNENNNNNNNNDNNNENKGNTGNKKNNQAKTNEDKEPSLIEQGMNKLNNTFSSIKDSVMGEPSNENKINKNNKNNKNKSNNNEKEEEPVAMESRNNRGNVAETGGESIWMLVIKVVIMVIILIAIYYIGSYLITRYLNTSLNTPYLLNTTKNGKNALVVSQDPNSINYIPIKKSEGQDGIQFTYGFWFLIESMDYKKGEWKHMFHKGNSSSYPNRAPGVWIHPDRNSIRIYMNTMDNILEYVDVDNLPIRKWVYMNVVLNNRNLDIYVNGYVKVRKELSSLPKQNDDDFWVSMYGGFEGYLSNIRYYAYAVNFNEIYNNIKNGPSVNNCIDTGEVPPYLDDKWWFDYNG
jgi:hypothetical protein